MKHWLKYLLAFLVGLSVIVRSGAEDTDLFEQQVNTVEERPNVLILLDNTANWNTPFDWEKQALVSIFNGLSAAAYVGKFNIGLMMYSETGGGNSNIDGGYVRYHVRRMANGTVIDGISTTDTISQLSGIVNGLDILNDKSNGGKASLIMDEAYRYFAGKAADGGAQKVKADLGAWDNGVWRVGAGSGNYFSPIANGCAKNFIIYISNGPPADNASDISRSTSDLAGYGGNTTAIPVSPSGSQTVVADEWARFMAGNDVSSSLAGNQFVTTYSVDVLPGTTGQGPGWTALLKSMASRGNGRYFAATDLNTLISNLQNILDEILATNSVFAAVTLPVSVAVRGEYLNQIYMGVFRPDVNRSPRWPGNVKLYQLGAYDTGSGYVAQLQDADGNQLEDTTSGFVRGCARSYWTSTSSFWNFSPNVNCNSSDPTGGSDSPDGNVVEKGGAGQRLRTTYASSQSTRNMFTCLGCTGGTALSSQPFSTSNSDVVTAITNAYNSSVSNVPVTLVRSTGSGVVTATATSDVNLVTGDTITLSSASDAAYNMTTTVTGSSSATTFTFNVTPVEIPEVSACASGCTASKATSGSLAGSSLIRSGLAVTVTTSVAHGLTAGLSQVTLSGVALPSPFNAGANNVNPFNNTFTVASTPTATTFTFNLTNPGYSASVSSAAAKVGAISAPAITDIRVNGYTVTLSAGSNFNNAFGVTTNNVATTGVLPAQLSCNDLNTACFKIAAAASCDTGIGSNANRRFCYETVPTSISSAFTVTPGTSVPITGIVRPAGVGSQTATVTTSVNHGFSTGNSIIISGATGNNVAYNGAKSITTGGGNTFTFPVTVTETPATSATANVTKGASSVVTNDLINWIRGADNFEDENAIGAAIPLSASTDIRASAHGDVVHSRPVVIDYFSGGASDVVVFYGANDGALHAVQGGTGGSGGTELWSFVASEHFGKFLRLRNQTPSISASVPKPYFFDGPIGSYVKRNTDGTTAKAYLFATMRRGGRYIYAFDVTSKSNPKFLWKKGCPNSTGSTGCDAGFSELGQTWSMPMAARLQVGSAEKIAVVVGAGYDNNSEDVDTATPAARAMGRGVFILDADDGTILKAFGAGDGIEGSVTGDAFVADGDRNGWDDLVYVADTHGDVWRIDMGATSASSWSMHKLASLGANQKFLFAPVATGCSDSVGNFFAVMVGAGDREHPKETAAACGVSNYFYMIKDRQTTSASGSTTGVVPAGLTTVTPGASWTGLADNDTGDGWKLPLTADTCEKTVSGAAIADGNVFFNTHAPTNPDYANGICTSLGTARTYALGACNAAPPEFAEGAVLPGTLGCGGMCMTLAGGGLAPSPVSANVKLEIPSGGSGGEDTKNCGTIIIGTSTIPLKCTSAGARYRTYWYEVRDK